MIEIPLHQDEPRILAFWYADEIIPICVCFLVGFMMEQMLMGLILGYMVMKLVRKNKSLPQMACYAISFIGMGFFLRLDIPLSIHLSGVSDLERK